MALRVNVQTDEETLAKVREAAFDAVAQQGFGIDDNSDWSVVIDARMAPTGVTQEFGAHYGLGKKETITGQRLEWTVSFQQGDAVASSRSFAEDRPLGGSLSVPRGKTAQQAHEADLWDAALPQIGAMIKLFVGADPSVKPATPGQVASGTPISPEPASGPHRV